MKYGLPIILVGVIAIGIWLARPSFKRNRSETIVEKSSEQISGKLPTQLPMSNVKPESEEATKLKILDEVLTSKNDNDPRLDKEFNNLSPEIKGLFREKYANLPAEKRNERGTIVFLLGRNLKDTEDFRFLETVVSEPPCYNLADCKSSPEGSTDAAHAGMGEEITLAYPQIVSIKAMEKYLGSSEKIHMALAIRVLETAKTSPVRVVSAMASDKLSAFQRSNN